MDLADLRYLKKYNDQYNYVLNVRHIFKLCLERTTEGQDSHFNYCSCQIFIQNRKPINQQSDKATEFVNATVQGYLKYQGVNFHTTHNPDINTTIMERCNRTLKRKMYKYFTKKCTNIIRHGQTFDKLQLGPFHSMCVS